MGTQMTVLLEYVQLEVDGSLRDQNLQETHIVFDSLRFSLAPILRNWVFDGLCTSELPDVYHAASLHKVRRSGVDHFQGTPLGIMEHEKSRALDSATAQFIYRDKFTLLQINMDPQNHWVVAENCLLGSIFRI